MIIVENIMFDSGFNQRDITFLYGRGRYYKMNKQSAG